MARLRHPNILPIFGYGEEDGLSYFVMDLVEGGTLKDLMGTPLPADRVEGLITQIAGALNHAHEQGIVHRDVKPSNVLMLRPDWALLSDFGIARVLEQTTNTTHTGSAFFGTPHYMAPEQARGEPVSPRTDQYALGIVLYEMLTGATPYRADTPQAVVYQHIYSPPPPPRDRNPAISPSSRRSFCGRSRRTPRTDTRPWRSSQQRCKRQCIRQAHQPSPPSNSIPPPRSPNSAFRRRTRRGHSGRQRRLREERVPPSPSASRLLLMRTRRAPKPSRLHRPEHGVESRPGGCLRAELSRRS